MKDNKFRNKQKKNLNNNKNYIFIHMLIGKKYRIYPTKSQEVVLQNHFDGVRCVYNLALECKNRAYQSTGINLSRYNLQDQLPELKKEFNWLSKVNSQSFQVVLINLDASFVNFFKGGGYPNFKKKSVYNKFNCPQGFHIENNKLYIPKLKTGIKIILHRDIEGTMKNVTISKTSSGEYYASILVDNGKEKPTKVDIKYETSVGFDLGIKSFIVDSNGKEYENPKNLKKSLKKLKCLQRKLSRKKKGSSNRKKARLKVAKLHNKIANKRLDMLHKVSNEITNQYDTLCFENLNIKGMSKRCKPKKDQNGNYIKNGQSAKSGLNKSILDAGWGMFTEFVKYKAEEKGKNYIEINRFAPSSKMCSCGTINSELTLVDRVWTCKSCNTINQRDFLAAKNIRNFAMIQTGVERPKEPVELPTLVGAVKQEASIPLG